MSSRTFLERPVNMIHKLKGLDPLCFAGAQGVHQLVSTFAFRENILRQTQVTVL